MVSTPLSHPAEATPRERADTPSSEQPGARPHAGRPGRPTPAGAALVPYLDSVLRPAWVRVDLDALGRNARRLADAVAPARLGAVVKADAYGHGAVEVARALADEGAELVAVALLEEGVELRRSGLRLPILVLGTLEPGQLPVCHRHALTPALSSLQQLALWRDFTAGSLGAPLPVHLKIDTGMSRLGVAPDEVPRALEILRAAPELRLTGLMSHFGDADDLASPRNDEQARAFDALLPLLAEGERREVLVHFANSAAALHRPPSRFDLVRFGLALYGLDPVGPGEPGHVAELEPVASVAARISQVREVPAGRAAGYGSRWVAERPSRLAVVPVGYADGYPWSLTNRGEALLRGRRVPMAGAVSMDLTIFDVTGLEDGGGGPISSDDEVVLLGSQASREAGEAGGEEITAFELAERAGTIPWEILTRLGERLPRCYLRAGEVVAVASRFVGTRR